MPTLLRSSPTLTPPRRAAAARHRTTRPAPRRATELTPERRASLRAQFLSGAWDTPAHAVALAARLVDLGLVR